MPIVFASFAIAPYAALLGLFYVFLSVRVANYRRRERVGIGHTDHAVLERRVRAHGNFIEYVPLALLLLLLCGATGSPPLLLHLLGIALVVGRLLHAFSILREEPQHQRYYARALGMVLTLAVISIASIILLLHWIGYSAST